MKQRIASLAIILALAGTGIAKADKYAICTTNDSSSAREFQALDKWNPNYLCPVVHLPGGLTSMLCEFTAQCNAGNCEWVSGWVYWDSKSVFAEALLNITDYGDPYLSDETSFTQGGIPTLTTATTFGACPRSRSHKSFVEGAPGISIDYYLNAVFD